MNYILNKIIKFYGFSSISILWITGSTYSGNGLVLSGNKPLPPVMMIKIYDTLWCDQATLGKDIDGLVQNCSISITNTLDIPGQH